MAVKSSAAALAEAFGDTNMSTEDRISKAKIQLYRESPFYSYLVTHLNFQKAPVPTMGVTEMGTCFYNDEWVQKLSIPQLIGVIAHEVQHLALRHHQRCNNRNIMVNGMSLWNIAIDISDNHLLIENGFTLPEEAILPRGGSVSIFGTTINGIADKSSEEIYEELKAYLKSKVKESEGKGDNGDDNSIQVSGDDFENAPNAPKEMDQHMWEDKNPEKNGEGSGNSKGEIPSGGMKEKDGKGKEEGKQDIPQGQCTKDWGKIFHEAYNHAKLVGKEPAGMARQMDEMHKGHINWRSVIRRLVASKLPYDLTYRRPNRKYLSNDMYLPSFVGETIKVICSLDTSGSISQKDITDFMSEIISLSKSYDHVEFRVLTHDMEVHDDVRVTSGNIRKLLAFTPHGGGGTSHIPLYEYIKKKGFKNREDLKLLISFTDGYSDFPNKKPDVDTVFVLSGGHVPKEQMPKWATAVITVE